MKFWFRYVGDVIDCFRGTIRKPDTLLNFINRIHPNINLTFEIENDRKINFSDLTLTRNKINLSFEIYRKQIFTDSISFVLLSPISNKLSLNFIL